MTTSAAPANFLLAALPAREYAALLPSLEAISLPTGTVLAEPGVAISYVYFPTAGMISLLAIPAGSNGVEAGAVGREGFAGLPVFLGAESSPGRCVVQLPLEALRIEATNFLSCVNRHGSLRALLLRYTHYLLCQISQSLACGVSHPIEHRLCRWLLMVHDRAGSDRFPLTHEFLANMLGVRRASISEVAAGLQERGLIQYRRGRVTVLDRAGLEEAACECFQVIENEWKRLFGK
jgi:CRP-like cAMP-binding protein